MSTDPIEIIAHRGDPVRAPENTLASLRSALLTGAHALEWDVQVCRSGVPMVIHDETVDRTTDGTGRVADLTVEELGELDAGSWFGEEYAGERIPTLAAALELVRTEAVGVYLEMKAVRDPEDIGTILDQVRRAGAFERTLVIAFDPEILRAFRARAPGLFLGRLIAEEAAMEPALRWVREEDRAVLAPGAHLLLQDPVRTRELVDEGITIGTWTVDEETDARALVELGVTRLTTNRVREMLAWAGRARK